MNPIERVLFAVSAAQRLVERTTALVDAAQLISNKARAVRFRAATLRFLAQQQRVKPPV